MLRFLLRLLLGVTLAFVVGLTALLWSLHSAFEPSRDEVARLQSPDREATAVLYEVNGGATTSFGYEVVLVRGQAAENEIELASLYGAARNDSAAGVNLKWVSPTALHIEYLEAKSAKLRHSTVKLNNGEIRVALRPGVRDDSAPSGGMLYNLRDKSKN